MGHLEIVGYIAAILFVVFIVWRNTNKEREEKKADRERAKDPILFGKYMYDEENYYYLADWVDEYCDLTLAKFVDEMNKAKPAVEYAVEKIPFVDEDSAEAIKTEAARRWNLFHGPRISDPPKVEQPKKRRWWPFGG